jgi:single-stranded DNA-binding protein
MSIKLEVVGRLGKDPYVKTIKDCQVTILSLACRRGSSHLSDWVTGSIWEARLGSFVLEKFKKGDMIQAFGTLSNLMVYFDSVGKPKPGLDFIIHAVGIAPTEKEK